VKNHSPKLLSFWLIPGIIEDKQGTQICVPCFQVEREVLIGFDLLLVLVLGLLLYSISARDPQQPPGRFDILQLLLVASALIVDVLALWE